MNTKIYKNVLSLTDHLMAAAEAENQKKFDGFYQQLKALCEEHETTDKDHPVQWETLGDFTEDLAQAVTVYEKAFTKAETINSKDFLSSIGFSIATLKVELNDKAGAIEHLQKAKVNSNKIVDKQLKSEIHNLLVKLSGSDNTNEPKPPEEPPHPIYG